MAKDAGDRAIQVKDLGVPFAKGIKLSAVDSCLLAAISYGSSQHWMWTNLQKCLETIGQQRLNRGLELDALSNVLRPIVGSVLHVEHSATTDGRIEGERRNAWANRSKCILELVKNRIHHRTVIRNFDVQEFVEDLLLRQLHGQVIHEICVAGYRHVVGSVRCSHRYSIAESGDSMDRLFLAQSNRHHRTGPDTGRL